MISDFFFANHSSSLILNVRLVSSLDKFTSSPRSFLWSSLMDLESRSIAETETQPTSTIGLSAAELWTGFLIPFPFATSRGGANRSGETLRDLTGCVGHTLHTG